MSFKVIFADDERNIRDGIRLSIPWQELDLDLVECCKNGVDAYSAILEHTPDIVITDIRMPKMDGLDLIKTCSKYFPHIHFIILSGYDDFTYAQEAMAYRVRFFLLKPCPKEKLIDALRSLLQDCIRDQKENAMKKSFQSSLHHLEDHLLSESLIQLLSTGRSDIIENSKLESLDFQQISLQLLYIYYLEVEHLDHFRQAFRSSLDAMYCPSIPFFVYVRNTLIIICKDNLLSQEKRLTEICHRLSFDEDFRRIEIQFDEPKPFPEVVSTLIQKTHRFGQIYYYYNHSFFDLCKYEEGKEENKTAFPSFPTREGRKYSDFIYKILEYTAKHLEDPSLTLKRISEDILYMNPDYVSRQFVLQTGTKYSTHLNKLRIQAAKKMLRYQPNKKMYEIAQEIGLRNNPQYFSSLFKKYTGMSPKEFIFLEKAT